MAAAGPPPNVDALLQQVSYQVRFYQANSYRLESIIYSFLL